MPGDAFVEQASMKQLLVVCSDTTLPHEYSCKRRPTAFGFRVDQNFSDGLFACNCFFQFGNPGSAPGSGTAFGDFAHGFRAAFEFAARRLANDCDARSQPGAHHSIRLAFG